MCLKTSIILALLDMTSSYASLRECMQKKKKVHLFIKLIQCEIVDGACHEFILYFLIKI